MISIMSANILMRAKDHFIPSTNYHGELFLVDEEKNHSSFKILSTVAFSCMRFKCSGLSNVPASAGLV